MKTLRISLTLGSSFLIKERSSTVDGQLQVATRLDQALGEEDEGEVEAEEKEVKEEEEEEEGKKEEKVVVLQLPYGPAI